MLRYEENLAFFPFLRKIFFHNGRTNFHHLEKYFTPLETKQRKIEKSLFLKNVFRSIKHCPSANIFTFLKFSSLLRRPLLSSSIYSLVLFVILVFSLKN